MERLLSWGSGYEAGCSGKAAYPSESGARAALVLSQREGVMRTGAGLDVYRCRYCNDWHIGHAGRGNA